MNTSFKVRLRFALTSVLLLLLICAVMFFSGQNDMRRYVHGSRIEMNSTSPNSGKRNPTKSIDTDQPATSFVLLLAYHRSGSTLTADIIQQSNRVFYFYEPVRGFSHGLFLTKNMYCIGNICRYPMSVQEEPVAVEEQISHIFSCKMRKVHKSIFDEMNVTWERSMDEAFYYKCLKSNSRDVCVKQLGKRCARAQVRLIKTTRLTFDFVEDLLKSHKNLKILHLIRDPRGHFASEEKVGWINISVQDKKRLQYEYNFFCKRLLEDIIVSENLKKSYGDRIKTILYEDIAAHPVQSLHEIYKFIGIPVTNYTKNYVIQNTMAGRKDNGIYEIQRSNSTATAYKWKKTLHPIKKLLIELTCKSFYDMTKFYSL